MTRLGPALIFIGLVIALISGFADALGVGGPRAYHGLGWGQVAGVVVGIALVGAGRALVSSNEAHGPTTDETNGFPPPP
jgi:hypothetical protein